MTPSDLRDGRINVVVGFAPLKPAEFVVLRLEIRAEHSF
jgi:phage tail sheath protein FI